MKSEKVTDYLQEKNFKQYEFESVLMTQLEELNIATWSTDSKLLMLKEYRTAQSLFEWNNNEHSCIASLLNYIPQKYINNLYFLLVLNFNAEDVSIRLEINKIEKNELICKKYVVKNEEDLNRIPFLMSIAQDSDPFIFDEKFKRKITEYNSNVEVHEQSKVLNIEVIMNHYFNKYLNNSSTFKVELEDLLGKED